MSDVIRLFTGYDPRETEGWHVFAQSVIERCSLPVAITPLTMNMQRDGTNAFTYSRFLVPYLCDFQGFAIFADGADMLALGDIAELWEMRAGWEAVSVVKHDYQTKHPVKYVGEEMESPNYSYPRKNWSSLIMWSCGNYLNRCLTPLYIEEHDGSHLHRFGWLPDDRIGEIPIEWGWMPDEYGPNEKAKLLHWTAGGPFMPYYKNAPMAEHWHSMARTIHSER